MSNSKALRRLHGVFSSTRKASNSIKTTPSPRRTAARLTSGINQVLLKSIQDLLKQKDPQKLVQQFKSLSKYSYFRQRFKLYDIVIHRLVLAKETALIEDVLESQKDYINKEAFGARIILLYGEAGMFEHAHKVFDEMPQRGFKHGERSFNILLGAALRAGEFGKVNELFRELPSRLGIKPSYVAYNTVIQALCKLNLLDEAVRLLDEMEENGLNPGVISYNILLCTFYEKGQFQEGDKIWDCMINKGVNPNVISYSHKLLRLFNDGKDSEAMELFTELKSKELKFNVGIYNALILGSCKNDDLDGVRRWYKELLRCCGRPNRVTFSIIVPLLCDKGDFELAYMVCLEILRLEYLVDEALLQKVVDGLAKNSMMEKAKDIVAFDGAKLFR
ncbi:pentatricopeptide repeat-containing protein At1g55890, mitochondrial-like isoform X2 [Amaranthus tricolor]|uniref:pentatricopeptide repeat-containing protein At1g55890, mitochondrial-like isoform X2 n=1 Tax=Amaranthus tricolor TaxID=29722 RepID=UPI0025876925|nr:pentatricopeptide repeat-containing protein At1g55890, mitochondrial-like isoform X2 [Amaranthus tricolor]